MDELHRSADKIIADAKHLEAAIREDNIDLALSTAKRVRRESTIIVRAIARYRDHAIAQEGTST